MSGYPSWMACVVALVTPALALGEPFANMQKTLPAGRFSAQVRHVIAEQAHRQEHLRKPLRIDTIHKYLGKQAWHVIWAEPQDSEMAVSSLASEGNRLRYVALWGGVVVPEDEPEIFAWLVSKAPDAPWDLRRCVADALATHEE